MEIIKQSFSHTPIWVYFLFAYLISRGVRSLRPREVTLAALAMIPAIFTAIGIAMLVGRFGLSASVFSPWLIALMVGTVIGWLILRGVRITVDRPRGVLFRGTPDYTVLPLILCSFAVKYIFGAMSFIRPELAQQPAFGVFEGAAYGLFAGIFIGKFTGYTMRYLREPSVNSLPLGNNA